MKYRLLSGNEKRGNYIVTAFLGATLPTGEANDGAAHVTITTTVAAGKGWTADGGYTATQATDSVEHGVPMRDMAKALA